jgi:flagellar basal-body rod modification protein FlgD
MAVSGISGAASTSVATSRTSLVNNFDTFLQLLTTQLQNQNPLDPLDTNQFTQQLVQFAGVEQQLRQNENLESLVAIGKAQRNTDALNFVGATVTATGDTTKLQDGLAVWYVTSPKPAQANVTITNGEGSVVYAGTHALETGTQPYQWNGRTSTGTIAPAGNYKIKIDAVDTAGQKVTTSTTFSGVVDQVDVSGEQPVLLIGATLINIDQVKSVQRPTTPSTTNNTNNNGNTGNTGTNGTSGS